MILQRQSAINISVDGDHHQGGDGRMVVVATHIQGFCVVEKRRY
jgi:hypothetical protein